MRIAGTACVVESCTVVARGYHVASRARRPKFGYRTVSSDPSARISELTGNSSNTTSTTGVRVATDTSAPAASSTASGTVATKPSSPISGSARETDRNERKARDRTYTIAATTAGTIGSRSTPPRWGSRSRRSCNNTRNEKPEIATMCSAPASVCDTSATSASAPTTASGGTTARIRANTITSRRVEPRTTRNSGFPFNIENTGWPTP